jgi:GNAT superfamily N-acetyltransferase
MDGSEIGPDDLDYVQVPGAAKDASEVMLTLCRQVFADFDGDYLNSRLSTVSDPVLWLAVRAGRPVGFKFGYRRDADVFYSWLGGVLPEMRKHGIASALMSRQHAHALATGYRHVETRTRAANAAMTILNLRHGFRVCGFEVDARGVAMVWQRKALARG